MLQIPTIDLTTARKNLSKLIEQVFLQNRPVVIAKHNIPLVKITKVETNATVKSRPRKMDMSLFGIWKDKSKPTLELAEELRGKAWGRDKHGS